MPAYTVYHNPDFTKYISIDDKEGSIEILYDVVTFEANDMEEVFLQTNSIDGPWACNPELKHVFSHRSTSTGDVIRRLDDDTWWVVESVGFTKLREDELSSIVYGKIPEIIRNLRKERQQEYAD